MPGETFKKFAIYGGTCGHVTGYTIVGDMDARSLVYRDTHASERLESVVRFLSGGHSVDVIKAYATAADELRSQEFVKSFELSDKDLATMLPLLRVDDYVGYIEDVERYDSAKETIEWLVDDRMGSTLGFEGFTGATTPLIQIRNEYEYPLGFLQLEELHSYLMSRFALWRLPGARIQK